MSSHRQKFESPLPALPPNTWHYGYTKHTIRIPELGARLVYLRRGSGATAQLVDLPAMREGDRLTREAVEDLCQRSRIPKEDFGV